MGEDQHEDGRAGGGESPITWGEDGQPRSRLYGDVYFSTTDGLAESRAVFLQGAGLPDAWRGRRSFTVGELGFGSGLNIAALLKLWSETREVEARLHVFSVEAHPLSAAEAGRALGAWPEIADIAALMTARWPGRARGVHRMDLPEFGAVVDVAIGEAGEALAGWDGRADAWFLDGFSPALNPAMWRQELLDLVAARSARGARAATFTVAGAVRRGLAAAGFAVDKRPGFGRKRERLEAVWPGEPPKTARAPRAAVIGAGIAGAAAARALRALGVEPLVIEAEGPGAGPSGNPAALVTPRLDAGLGPGAELLARAFARAIQLYAAIPGAVIARGVERAPRDPRDPARFAGVAASDLFEPGALVATERLSMPAAQTIAPAVVLSAWLGPIQPARAASLAPAADGWRVVDATGAVIAVADLVIVAAGLASRDLVEGLPLRPVRGQLSFAAGVAAKALEWGGYVAPAPGGVVFGATHDRDDEGTEVRAADHLRNLTTLAQAMPDLAASLATQDLAGRAGVRATTRDHLPLAGEVAPGLHLLTGFGGRGFSLAPLLADHVAARALGRASPLSSRLAALVAPGRLRRD